MGAKAVAVSSAAAAAAGRAEVAAADAEAVALGAAEAAKAAAAAAAAEAGDRAEKAGAEAAESAGAVGAGTVVAGPAEAEALRLVLDGCRTCDCKIWKNCTCDPPVAWVGALPCRTHPPLSARASDRICGAAGSARAALARAQPDPPSPRLGFLHPHAHLADSGARELLAAPCARARTLAAGAARFHRAGRIRPPRAVPRAPLARTRTRSLKHTTRTRTHARAHPPPIRTHAGVGHVCVRTCERTHTARTWTGCPPRPPPVLRMSCDSMPVTLPYPFAAVHSSIRRRARF
jgi:hypothetical protein